MLKSIIFWYYFFSFQAGGTAGLFVDVALFPLDTIKTRIQSSQGFLKAGGFHGVYSGLGSAATGSAPAGKLSRGNQGHQEWGR